MFVKQDDEKMDGQTMAAVMNDEGPSKQLVYHELSAKCNQLTYAD